MTSRLTSICGQSISRRKVFQHLLVVGFARRPLCFFLQQIAAMIKSSAMSWTELVTALMWLSSPWAWEPEAHWGAPGSCHDRSPSPCTPRRPATGRCRSAFANWCTIWGQRTTILPSLMARPWWKGASIGQRSQPKEIKTTQFFTATVQTLPMTSRMSLKAFGSHSSSELYYWSDLHISTEPMGKPTCLILLVPCLSPTSAKKKKYTGSGHFSPCCRDSYKFLHISFCDILFILRLLHAVIFSGCRVSTASRWWYLALQNRVGEPKTARTSGVWSPHATKLAKSKWQVQ